MDDEKSEKRKPKQSKIEKEIDVRGGGECERRREKR